MNLIHIDHPNIPQGLRNTFAQKVINISEFLGINPNWLMQVMFAESKLNAQAKNIQNGHLIAAGLLQWTKASGVPPQSILQLNHLQQLDKIQEYFRPYKGKMHSYFDVYLITFFPLGIGKPDDFIFATKQLSAALIAKQNPIINANKDNKITLSEFKNYIVNSTPNDVRMLVFKATELSHSIVKKASEDVDYIEHQPESFGKAIGGIGTIITFFTLFVI